MAHATLIWVQLLVKPRSPSGVEGGVVSAVSGLATGVADAVESAACALAVTRSRARSVKGRVCLAVIRGLRRTVGVQERARPTANGSLAEREQIRSVTRGTAIDADRV
jgi:hypothetical protein